MREKDKAIWEQANQHLNVRNNDEHTLFSYLLAEILLENEPNAHPDIVLPAIMLHDTGWSKIPKDKILHAFGPNNKFPELTRQHELESVAIALNILSDLNFEKEQIEAIIALIDGHDTTKNSRSLDDAVHKDADKLWRFTPHGNRIIGEWFEIEQDEVMDILENYVMPTFLTEFGKKQAQIFLKTAQLNLNLQTYL
jgi:HD domain